MSNSKIYEDRLSASAFLEAFRRKKNKILMEELHITEEDVRVFFKETPKTNLQTEVSKKNKPKKNNKTKSKADNNAVASDNNQEDNEQNSEENNA